ncbi:hypothetical protein XalbCFBP2523_08170 [Xanthomonas albilineans]|nr:hypothetical protein XalbCFBP2523_08170 [Xanthomonas albilineans]
MCRGVTDGGGRDAVSGESRVRPLHDDVQQRVRRCAARRRCCGRFLGLFHPREPDASRVLVQMAVTVSRLFLVVNACAAQWDEMKKR